MTVFSPSDISGLRRPKNVKFGIKVASSMRMMHTLRFLEKVDKASLAKRQSLQKNTKIMQKNVKNVLLSGEVK